MATIHLDTDSTKTHTILKGRDTYIVDADATYDLTDNSLVVGGDASG